MANFDIASFNLLNWANSVVDLYDSTPKDVEITQKDTNGNLFTKTIANRGKFKKELWDDVGAAIGQMSRTFYVDTENGDDNNTGDSDHPFKTIQKAVNSVPNGGYGYINVSGDHNQTFYSKHKQIYINNGGVWTIPYKSFCDVSGDILISNQGQIIVDNDNGSDSDNENYAGFLASNYEKFFLSEPLNFVLVNYKTSNPVNITSGRALVGSRAWGHQQRIAINVVVTNLYCSDKFIVDGKIFGAYNGANSFQWTNSSNDDSFSLEDSSGNAVDIKDTISGIIKDSNGVPRNITSNIIF